MPTECAEPILPAKNLNETRSFYRKLGFTPWFDGQHWPDYEIMSRGNLVVHFFAAPELSDNNAGCYWRVTNADQFYGECVALGLPATGVPRLEGLCDQPWGMREFVLVDTSGNFLRIGHERDNERPS